MSLISVYVSMCKFTQINPKIDIKALKRYFDFQKNCKKERFYVILHSLWQIFLRYKTVSRYL